MNADYERKSGDTKPFEALLKVNRQVLPMAGSEVVRFHMRPKVAGAGPTVNQLAVIADATKALVRYTPQLAEVGTAGSYDIEWEVTFADGSIETFPANGFMDCILYDDIA